MKIPDFKITKLELCLIVWHGDDGSTVAASEITHEDFTALLENAERRDITPSTLILELVTDGVGTSDRAWAGKLKRIDRNMRRRALRKAVEA